MNEIINKKHINHKKACIKSINRFYLKLIICLISLCLLVKMNYIRTNQFQKEVKCFEDMSFVLSDEPYKILKSNKVVLYGFLIFAGLLVDIVVIFGGIMNCILQPSWRMLATVAVVYIFRGYVQGVYLMDHPSEQIFQYPGFSSLVVSYFETNDYFFSGHVAIPTIIGLEFRKTGYKMLSIFCFVTSFIECLLMIFTRGHYSIDIYAGYIFSFYFFRIVDSFIPFIDKHIGFYSENHKLYF